MAGKVGITITLDGVTAVSNELKKLGKQFETFGTQLRSVGTDLSIYVTAPLVAIGGAAVKVASDMEVSRIGFTSMLGSAEKAGVFLEDLAQFAAKTPFQFMELQATAKRLMAMGMTAEQVLPVLTGIGDAVSAMGGRKEDLDRALLAISQIKAKGKVMSEEMTRQLGQVIPAWDMLATALGISVAEAMKLVEEGAIDANTGIASLLSESQKRFPDMMTKMMGTVVGLLSNLEDVAHHALIVVGDAITETLGLKEKLQGLMDAVEVWKVGFEELDPIIREIIIIVAALAAGIGPLLVALSIVPTIIAAMANGLALVLTPAGGVIIALGLLTTAGILLYKNWDTASLYIEAAWNRIQDSVLAAEETILGAIKDMLLFMKEVADFVPDIFGGAWTEGIDMAIDSVGDVKQTFSDMRTGLKSDTEAIHKALEDKVIKSMEGVKKKTTESVDAWKRFNTTADATKGATKLITEEYAKLEEKLKTNETLAAALGETFEKNEADAKAMKKALEALAKLGVSPTDKEFKKLAETLKAVKVEIKETEKVSSDTAKMMSSAVKGTTDAVKMMWSDTTVSFEQAWKGALDSFVDNLIVMETEAKATSVAINWSMAAAMGGISLLVGTLSMVFGGGAKGPGDTALKQATKAFLTEIRRTLLQFEEEVLDALGRTTDKLELYKGRVSDVVDIFNNVLAAIAEFGQETFGGIDLDELYWKSLTMVVLDSMDELQDALKKDYEVRKQIARDTIKLYQEQQAFMQDMDRTIRDVSRALLTPQELLSAQQTDIAALQTALAAATPEDQIRIVEQLKQAYLDLWGTAQGLFEGTELGQWQQFVMEGLEGLKETGKTAYDQLIDINLEMLNLEREGLDIETQMLTHIERLTDNMLEIFQLMETFGTAQNVESLNALIAALGNYIGMPTIPAMAAGGIVNKPTMALIGEAGPEAVLPLSKAGALGGVDIRQIFTGPVVFDDISASRFAKNQAKLIDQEQRRYSRG